MQNALGKNVALTFDEKRETASCNSFVFLQLLLWLCVVLVQY